MTTAQGQLSEREKYKLRAERLYTDESERELKAQQELLREVTNLTYIVEETACYPCAWYGGQAWCGERASGASHLYFRTKGEALLNALMGNFDLLEKVAAGKLV